MTEQTNTPKLRFPEFSEEWENKSITDDFSIIDGDRGKHYPSSKDLLKKGDCIFLSAENITKKGWSFKNLKFITRKKDISMGKGKLKLNDLILTTRGTVGNVVRYHEEIPFQDMRINSGMVILRTIQPSQFFLTLFTSNFMKRFLNKVTVQSAQPHLTVATIKTMKFFIPKSIKEQEKIGTFFSKLDRQIELEEKKLELLEQQKKGYMQKIFSQELRFKDENGNKYPKWTNTLIKDLFINKGGTALEKEFENNGDYKVISIGSYSMNSTYNDQNLRINKNEKTEKYILSQGDLAMVLNDKTKDGNIIGRSIFIDKDNHYIYNQRTERLIPLSENDNKFLWFLMNTDIVRNKIKSMMQGATQVYINYSSIKNISLQIPSFEEQIKIREFLEILLHSITKQDNKVKLLKQRKQGLLQKMFV